MDDIVPPDSEFKIQPEILQVRSKISLGFNNESFCSLKHKVLINNLNFSNIKRGRQDL